MNNSARQVVITGMGIISPLGIGVDEFWDNIVAGNSGIKPIATPTNIASPQHVGGEVTEFTEKNARKMWLKQQRKSVKVMCRDIQMGVASAMIALEHSGVDLEQVNPQRFGVDFGANLMLSPPDVLSGACEICVDGDDSSREFHYHLWGSGGENSDGQSGMSGMEPLWLLRYLPNMPACHIGIAADARGPNNSITLADASGNLVIAEARRVIERDWADIMISGTTGTRLHTVKAIQAVLWDKLADGPGSPEQWCRPFDKNRRGLVVSEGSCSFILEEQQAANARGATVYATILGSAATCVIDKQGNGQLRPALKQAMQAALRDANLKPADIGHINAHAQGMPIEDAEEAKSILDVFGDTNPQIPVTAFKSYFGTSGSGTGPLELAGSILGLQHGIVPKTLNYEEPDPECPVNVVHGDHLKIENKIFMKLSVTRAGQAAVLIVQVP